MGQSSIQLQAKLMREYYRDFSKYAKGKLPARKTAWVTAFTPVEILEALDISAAATPASPFPNISSLPGNSRRS